MIYRVHVSDDDLESIEDSCRQTANLYRADAKRQANPGLRDNAIEPAERYERIADRTRRFRDSTTA
jgi:hypothetical protein